MSKLAGPVGRETQLVYKWAVLAQGFTVMRVLVQPDPNGDPKSFYPPMPNLGKHTDIVPYTLGVDIFETDKEAYAEGARLMEQRIATLMGLRALYLLKVNGEQ